MRNDKETACYTGYILKALSDAKRNLGDVKRYNLFTDFMDKESRVQIARIYSAIDMIICKCMQDVNIFGVIVAPDDKINENFRKIHTKVQK